MFLPGHQHGSVPHCSVWARCCSIKHDPKKSSMGIGLWTEYSVCLHEAFERSNKTV